MDKIYPYTIFTWNGPRVCVVEHCWMWMMCFSLPTHGHVTKVGLQVNQQKTEITAVKAGEVYVMVDGMALDSGKCGEVYDT